MTRIIADVFIVKTHTYPFKGWAFEGCYETEGLAKKVDAFYLNRMCAAPFGIDRTIERTTAVQVETPAGWRLEETLRGAIIMLESSFNGNLLQRKLSTLAEMVN